ncbi:hypothetical protein EDEG_01596 [Edhazardia aedis USNM 41457]|uniref:Proteasome alpha-type subunits domain-containing protein n=1 Tax=Edhazardia aedis (strain USNM 41457) TaxID=1003232 RepID=J9D8P3_EDHAE|nr:hypothetical protein EDEG_01596 [Edhazardia aedis USNM 41457]|eukprot:EJW04116.1 hypothetical protein EDEG_01596 [Edhazardia aedis USNM 41457]
MNFEIDHSLTTFTSEGTLNQCENALKAALNGSLSLSARSDDGIVLASLKYFPKLVEKESISKVFKVCDSIGMTYSGLQPDFRVIYDKAILLAEDYKYVYGRYPYADVFVHNLSRVIQEYTQKGGLRPFGVLLLICGFVEEKINGEVKVVPMLYQMEPSGSFQEVNVCAIGREYKGGCKYVENRLESLDDNIANCVGSLREHAGYSIDYKDVDIGVFRADTKSFNTYKPGDVKEVFDSIINK